MNQIVCCIMLASLLLPAAVLAETLITHSPYSTGDTIFIHGYTNFNTENRVLVEVYPSSFGPTSKYEPAMSGGGAMVVPVTRSEDGRYSWSVNMSTAGWNPDQYMVRAEVIGKDYRETAVISVIEADQSETQAALSEEPVDLAGEQNMTHEPLQQQPVLTPAPVPEEREGLPAAEPTRKSPLSLLTIAGGLAGAGMAVIAGRRG